MIFNWMLFNVTGPLQPLQLATVSNCMQSVVIGAGTSVGQENEKEVTEWNVVLYWCQYFYWYQYLAFHNILIYLCVFIYFRKKIIINHPIFFLFQAEPGWQLDQKMYT